MMFHSLICKHCMRCKFSEFAPYMELALNLLTYLCSVSQFREQALVLAYWGT